MAEVISKLKESVKETLQAAIQAIKGQDSIYKMLLIGETGSGKTSFLNLMCNCALVQTLGFQVDLEAFHAFNDFALEDATSRAMASKTSDAKSYDTQFGSLKIRMVDTPGFGDSRGMKEDKLHVSRIIEALKREEYINCVCLIINGRQSRMSATLKYVLSEITAILPKHVVDRVIVVFTNTSDPLDLNFETSELEKYFGKNIDKFFIIENPYCKFEKAKNQRKNLSMDIIAKSLQKGFAETAQTLAEMLTAIKDFEPVHTHHFTTLYNKKQEIERDVIILLTEYDNQTEKEKEMDRAEKEIEAAATKKTAYQDFRRKRKIKRMVTDSVPYHNTLCGVPGCYSICHEHCSLPKTFDKEGFLNCWAFPGTNCRKCGHQYTKHYHNEIKFRETIEEEEYTDDLTLRKFQEAKTAEERAKVLKARVQHLRDASLAKKKELSKKLMSKIDEFQQLGINRNYIKLMESQLDVIEQRYEAETGPAKHELFKTKQEMDKKIKLVKGQL